MSVADVFHEAIGAILEGFFGQMLSTPQNIYTWLTHPLLDPQKSGRVIMDHLMKLVTTALEWSYAQEEKDVSPKYLEAAAEQLTLRRDVIHLIDAVEGNQEDSEPNPK